MHLSADRRLRSCVSDIFITVLTGSLKLNYLKFYTLKYMCDTERVCERIANLVL